MLGLHSSHERSVGSLLQQNMLLPPFSTLCRDAVHTLQMHAVCSPWRRPERGPGEHRAAQHLFVKAAWRIITAYTPLGSPPTAIVLQWTQLNVK